MDCKDCLDKLYAFLDGELPPSEATKLRSHLDDCGGCEQQFTLEERFLTFIRDCCAEDVAPQELRGRIVDELRREDDASR